MTKPEEVSKPTGGDLPLGMLVAIINNSSPTPEEVAKAISEFTATIREIQEHEKLGELVARNYVVAPLGDGNTAVSAEIYLATQPQATVSDSEAAGQTDKTANQLREAVAGVREIITGSGTTPAAPQMPEEMSSLASIFERLMGVKFGGPKHPAQTPEVATVQAIDGAGDDDDEDDDLPDDPLIKEAHSGDRLRVYIAGPYSKPDPVANTHRAMEMWQAMWDAGYAPYCPHWTLLQHMHCPQPDDTWLLSDLIWLAQCDVLYRLEGESRGADREVEYAEYLGIPVVRTRRELDEAADMIYTTRELVTED